MSFKKEADLDESSDLDGFLRKIDSYRYNVDSLDDGCGLNDNVLNVDKEAVVRYEKARTDSTAAARRQNSSTSDVTGVDPLADDHRHRHPEVSHYSRGSDDPMLIDDRKAGKSLVDDNGEELNHVLNVANDGRDKEPKVQKLLLTWLDGLLLDFAPWLALWMSWQYPPKSSPVSYSLFTNLHTEPSVDD